MNWLSSHAFLAGWLALPLSVFAIFAQNRGKEVKDIDWTWAIIYLTFGITLGVTLTPTFDRVARDFTQWLATLSFFAILFNRRRS
jgi:hypothetical protein